MLEIKHLKTLQTLAQQGNLIKTAEKLHLTQSALSHQIKQLEDFYETQLFKRKTQPLEFTPTGKLLLDTAHQVLPLIEATKTDLKRITQGEQGRLKIGVECHTCFEWLLPLVRPFQQDWPLIDLDIASQLSIEAQEALLENELDLVITSDPLTNQSTNQIIQYTPLFSYEIQLVTAQNSPLAQKDWLKPQDLKNQTLISYPVAESKLDIFSQFLNPAKVRPQEKRTTDMTLIMLHWVENQKGVCALPKWLLDTQTEFNHLPRKQLGAQGLHATLYAAYTNKTKYLEDFIEKIQTR